MGSRYKAYTGKILDIDLSTGKVGEYVVDDRDRERFVGGRYLSTKILWDCLEPGVDPLGPENICVIMTGPLTGTGAPSSSRYDISAKSPLTGGLGHSNSGGNFGLHLKRAGFDGIVLRGRAKNPVYLEIENNSVSILDAAHLWGKDTQQTQEALGAGGTLAIGPAGENLVPFATVASQERAHGRTGMGAVLGSKNVKAMVARGKNKVEIAQPEAYKQCVRQWMDLLKGHPSTGRDLPAFGTAIFVNPLNEHNALPTRNFSKGRFEDVQAISGERLAHEFMVKNTGCVTCPIRCGRVVEVDGKQVKGPEYEILSLMGSNLGVADLSAIIRWNYELDLLGLDTISTGNILGFAAELNEKGLWKNGLEFGNVEAFSRAISQIASRKGIGADLALGVKALSEKYGGKDFAAHVKGLEVPAYEPRSCVGHGLGYAVAPRGACHLDGGYLVYFELTGPATLNPRHFKSKPTWAIFAQNLLGAISAGGNCLFTSWTALHPVLYSLAKSKPLSFALETLMTAAWPVTDRALAAASSTAKVDLPFLPHPKAIRLATGLDMDLARFIRLGERGSTMDKLFNLREGIGRADDTLPGRFLKESLPDGGKNAVVPLSDMLPKYYRLRGWDKNGVPTLKTLKKLDLGFAADMAAS
jgi:aldehyde:ferredoxin oxidoreductase